MADIALGALGAAYGSLAGGVTLMEGYTIGMTLGGLLFPQSLGTIENGKQSDIRFQGASVGGPIVKGFGVDRYAGTAIWTTSVLQTVTTSGGGGGSGAPTYTQKDYHYRHSLAVLICKGPIQGIRRIWANQNVIMDSRGGVEVWDKSIDTNNVAIYFGDELQDPDPTMEAALGVGNVPAYRGYAYIVFTDFNLDNYNGQPANFTFEVDHGDSDAETICNYLCEASGLLPDEYDFSAVSTKSIRGLSLPGKYQARNVMDELANVLFFRIVEVDGKIKAVVRGGSSVVTFSENEFGADLNKNTGDKANIKMRQVVELPRSITVSYKSETKDFDTNTQYYQRQTDKTLSDKTISLNMVISDNQARQMIQTAIHSEWIQRMSFAPKTSYNYLYLSPGSIVTIPTPLGNKRAEVIDMSFSTFGPISFSMLRDESAVYTQSISGAAGDANGTVSGTDLPYMFVQDINAVVDSDADYVGFYAATVSTDTAWSGNVLYVNPGVNHVTGYYTEKPLTFNSGSLMGVTTSVLADGPTGVWDRTSYVDVELYRGSLSSAASELDVLNGKNTIVIGFEIVSFLTATPLGGNQYRLSNLIRGRRGTEYATSDHYDGEPIIFVNSNAQRFNTNAAFKGMSLGFRVIDNGRYYSTLPAYTNVTISGRSRMPYSPCHLKGSRDGSNNLTLNWTRRVRKGGDLVDYTDAVLDEAVELYDVVIYSSSSYGTIKRTISNITSPTYTYTAADQITDFGSVQLTVYFIVYQVSTVVGRGFGSRGAV